MQLCSGHDLLLLALYRITFPKATAAEINAFLYRANYGSLTFRFYSPSQISETEKWIGLTRKKGSTTAAYQALLPFNKHKRWAYWNLPYPYGIADIRRQDIIDLDECGVEVQSADRNMGKAYVGRRVKQIICVCVSALLFCQTLVTVLIIMYRWLLLSMLQGI